MRKAFTWLCQNCSQQNRTSHAKQLYLSSADNAKVTEVKQRCASMSPTHTLLMLCKKKHLKPQRFELHAPYTPVKIRDCNCWLNLEFGKGRWLWCRGSDSLEGLFFPICEKIITIMIYVTTFMQMHVQKIKSNYHCKVKCFMQHIMKNS